MPINLLQRRIRGRWAIAAMFFVNGFLIGSWAPQIPVFLTRLGITEFTLGLLILLFGAGAVSAMAWAGHLMARHGSRTVVTLFAVAGSFGLLLVALAPSVPFAAVAMFLFGGMIGGMDVAMNANAVTVEKKLSRAIMSSSHGFWSLGGFVGGGLGGIVIQNYGHLAHAALVTAVIGADRRLGDPASARTICRRPAEHRKFSLPRSPSVYLLGLMALLCMNSEGAVLDWGALYLRQELGADIATAGFAYAGLCRHDGGHALSGRWRSQPLRRGDDLSDIGAGGCSGHAGCRARALAAGWPSRPSPSADWASPTRCRSCFRQPATSLACRRARA